ncbi:unnamed protein product [Cuscuta epithymum]|uniref:Uncharacterized protein n=1 Tax=Cuscuta epithymum TaxID=186058 RepID=A0AAV0FYA1_9ASTE|nr:unnamed protein product [Cuscuta epithymum]
MNILESVRTEKSQYNQTTRNQSTNPKIPKTKSKGYRFAVLFQLAEELPVAFPGLCTGVTGGAFCPTLPESPAGAGEGETPGATLFPPVNCNVVIAPILSDPIGCLAGASPAANGPTCHRVFNCDSAGSLLTVAEIHTASSDPATAEAFRTVHGRGCSVMPPPELKVRLYCFTVRFPDFGFIATKANAPFMPVPLPALMPKADHCPFVVFTPKVKERVELAAV